MELNRADRPIDFMKINHVRFPDVYISSVLPPLPCAHGIPVSSHEIFPANNGMVDGVEHLSATSRRGIHQDDGHWPRYDDVLSFRGFWMKSDAHHIPARRIQYRGEF